MRKNIFEKYINKTDTCWLWTGYLDNGGYGKYSKTTAHRASYKLYKGEIPEGLFILHTCDVRNCVNPEHLWLGTTQQNTQDRQNKNRQTKGINVNTNKLTESQVLEIIDKYKNIKIKYGAVIKLAKEYGIDRTNIYSIINKKTWKHLP